jgi:NADH-quinone oxidoreductase subunit M
MVPVLLILIPLLGGLISFFIKNENQVRSWSLLISILSLFVSFLGLSAWNSPEHLVFKAEWMQILGSSFDVRLDGMGQLLCLLTSFSFPIIFIATWTTNYKSAHNFFALMLLTQAGLMGVFVAFDALLFYFFWELALIPVYFLCSQWGGEKRIQVTIKFFIYTFVGSVLMLAGILYLNNLTPDRSFSLDAFYKLQLSGKQQLYTFFLFFMAFAIKMPIFPFHTWQPDTYEQAPTATTMVLSGIMVKMGVFGLIRWLLPVLPMASFQWADMVTWMAIIGMIYASIIAIQQDDLKRLVAYSSIAHIGLMCAAVFAETQSGMQGVMLQMFNHGINIIGLWIVVEIIERQFGTRKMSELGGLAQKAPALAIFFVIIALANIALPLTNAFAGEFMMFNGIFNTEPYYTKYNVWFTVVAGLSIILAAVYTLNMLQKVLFGNTNALTGKTVDIDWHQKVILSIIVVAIFMIGVYSAPVLELTQGTTDTILKEADVRLLFKKN